MNACILLDTHILIRWINRIGRISSAQSRALRSSLNNFQPLGVSAITLIEIAQLSDKRVSGSKIGADAVFEVLASSPSIEIIPIGVTIAREFAVLMPILRDPADSVIVATARVHGLRLLTSDQRIIDSKLVPVIE